MSLANKYDVENVIENIEVRLKEYAWYDKDWSKYSLMALFPTGWYLGDIGARYNIFHEEEKSWL